MHPKKIRASEYAQEECFVGRHLDEIVLGDAFDFLPLMRDESVELVLTDIPYNVVNRPSGGIRSFDKGAADDARGVDIDILLSEAARIARGSVYIFCSTEQVSAIRSGLDARGLTTRLCIWEKTNPSPVNGQYLWLSGIECCVFGRKKGAVFSEHCKNTVWRFPNGRSKIHPTEKPLKLFEYIVRTSSRENDVVLDMFSGSGTTAAACVLNNRRFVAVEKDEKYHALSVERIETLRKEILHKNTKEEKEAC